MTCGMTVPIPGREWTVTCGVTVSIRKREWTVCLMTESDSSWNGNSGRHVPLAVRRSRLWPVDVKRRIVEETFSPGASVPVVARQHDVNANLVFEWRKQYREGRLGNGKTVARATLRGSDLMRIGVIDDDGGLRPSPSVSESSPPPRPKEPAVPESRVASLSGLIEIELPNGVKVRVDAGIGEAALRRILAAAGAPA